MAKGKLPRPTQSEIFELLEARRLVLNQMHQDMNEADDWLNAHEKPMPSRVRDAISSGMPDSWTERDYDVQPYAFIELNRAVNTVSTAEVPQANHELASWYKRRYPRKGEEDEREVRLACQSILRRIVTNKSENPLLDVLQQQMGLGLGAISYPIDYDVFGDPPDHGRGTPEEEDAWLAYEYRRATTLPYRIESLHPTWVFPDMENDPPVDIIVERPVSPNAVRRMFPDLDIGTGQGEMRQNLKYVEYISKDWYACYVSQEATTKYTVTPGGARPDDEGVAENPRGFIWVQLVWSGLGKLDEYGSMHRRGIGLVRRHLGNYIRRTWNDNWLKLLKRAYAPKLIAEDVSQEESSRQVSTFDPTVPSVAAMGTTRLRWLESPNVPHALLTDTKQAEDQAEAYAGPGVLSGENKSEPASKYSARLEQARGPFRTPKANMEQAVANMLRDMMLDFKAEPDMADGYQHSWSEGEGATAKHYSVYLKPEQIHPEAAVFSVDLSPMTLQDKAANQEAAIQKRDAGLITTERAMREGAEIEDVEEELAQITAEKVLQSDTFMMRLAEAAANLVFGPPPAPPQPEPGMAVPGAAPLPAPPGQVPPPALPGVSVPAQPPGPPLGSGQEAMAMGQSAFAMPQNIVRNGTNGY